MEQSQLQAKVQSQVETARGLRNQERDLLQSLRVSERLLLLEELLEIASPLDDSDADTRDASVSKRASADPQRLHTETALSDTDNDDDDDDGFDNFDAVQERILRDSSAAETCARLERATQNLVELELEFDDGADIPTVQVPTN